MRRLLLVLCAIYMIFAATICFADTENGVLVEDRVINLPNDQGKWYISVVGDIQNAQYQMILKWFDQDPALRKLKSQVHFCPVASNSVIYRARYSMNVKGLPTVRFQNSSGVVIYEAAGKNLPFTTGGLYGALADGVTEAQGRPVLPWRRNRVPCPRRPCPRPGPGPGPGPDLDLDLDLNLDPVPQPINSGGIPEVEPVQSNLPPLWLMLIVLVVAASTGAFVEWRATYAEK